MQASIEHNVENIWISLISCFMVCRSARIGIDVCSSRLFYEEILFFGQNLLEYKWVGLLLKLSLVSIENHLF